MSSRVDHKDARNLKHKVSKLYFTYKTRVEKQPVFHIFKDLPLCSSVLCSRASLSRSTSCHNSEFCSRSSNDSFKVRLTFSLWTYCACSSFIFSSANLKSLLCFSLNSWRFSSSSVAQLVSRSWQASRDSVIIWSLFWDSSDALALMSGVWLK